MKNPVAKNLNKFNKPAVHRNKKKEYKRERCSVQTRVPSEYG